MSKLNSKLFKNQMTDNKLNKQKSLDMMATSPTTTSKEFFSTNTLSAGEQPDDTWASRIFSWLEQLINLGLPQTVGLAVETCGASLKAGERLIFSIT